MQRDMRSATWACAAVKRACAVHGRGGCMKIRTKLGILAAVLTLSLIVTQVWLASSAASPAITVRLVEHAGNETILEITNHTRLEFLFTGVDETLRKVWFSPAGSYLGPHEGFTLTIMDSRTSPSRVSMQLLPWRGSTRRRVESMLDGMGVHIASTGFVSTVDVPPR